MAALALTAMAGVFYPANTDNAPTRYVRVDDAAARQKADGGEGAWEYALDARDEGGGHRQLTFTAGSKRLMDGAYLRLGHMPVRGAVSREEAQPGRVPDAARERLA